MHRITEHLDVLDESLVTDERLLRRAQQAPPPSTSRGLRSLHPESEQFLLLGGSVRRGKAAVAGLPVLAEGARSDISSTDVTSLIGQMSCLHQMGNMYQIFQNGSLYIVNLHVCAEILVP